MKTKLAQIFVLGIIGAIAILVRPSSVETAPPSAGNADTVDGFHAFALPTANSLLPLDGATKFPNSVLYTGSGNGLDADFVDGIDSSSFVQQNQLAGLQNKIISKYASKSYLETPDTTTALPSAPVDMPATTINFTADEITGPTNLVINWATMIYNNTAGWQYGVETHIMVDGVDVATTHISQAIAGGAWMQHAANAVVPVQAGAHTIWVKWNVFWDGGIGVVADRDLTVLAVPQ